MNGMGLLQKIGRGLGFWFRALVVHPFSRAHSADERTAPKRLSDALGVLQTLPASDDDRRLLAGASRCIQCGLCDAFDPLLSSLPRTLHSGASLIPTAYSRSAADLLHLRAQVGALVAGELGRAEAVCPTRVPLRAIASALREKLQWIPALPAATLARGADVRSEPHR